MKKDMLKIGTAKGEFGVEVEIDIPESLEDCAVLSKVGHAIAMLMPRGSDNVGISYMVAKFTRGYRIDLQEGGARQAIAELLGGKSAVAAMKDADLVARAKKLATDEIAAFDPAAPRARGGRKPAAPQVVTIEAGKTSFTAEEVQAMLAGLKGIQVVES